MQLIHPVYLDVPMVMSFAAALEGGISLTTEVTKENDAAESEASEAGGRLGLSGLIGNLLDLSASKSKSTATSEAAREVVKESRHHTEASIAIVVYDRLLSEDGLLTRIKSVEDFEQLEPGTLVEVAGTIQKNAVDAMIDYLGAAKIMMGLDSTTNNAATKATMKQLDKLQRALSDDRNRTPISNVLVRCQSPEGMSAILTLRKDNLRDLTLSELHKNDMRVVGKVTRRIPKDESVVTFENYGLGMLGAEALRDMFSAMGDTEGLATEFAEVAIQGPAVQLLPLMVFV